SAGGPVRSIMEKDCAADRGASVVGGKAWIPAGTECNDPVGGARRICVVRDLVHGGHLGAANSLRDGKIVDAPNLHGRGRRRVRLGLKHIDEAARYSAI